MLVVLSLLLSGYKHWSLREALEHSPLVFAGFRLHEVQGAGRLDSFLAQLGLPKAQARQKYSGMAAHLRAELLDAVQRQLKEEPKLGDLVYSGFEGRFAWTHRLTALDAVAATAATLEAAGQLRPNVSAALATLSLNAPGPQRAGLELWKSWLESCRLEVHSALSSRNVRVTPNFFLYTVPPGAAHEAHFRTPHALGYFGRFLLRAFSETPAVRRKPLVRPLLVELRLPADADEEAWTLVAGIPPLTALAAQHRPKSFLPQAFRNAAAKCDVVPWPAFDASILKIKTAHMGRFMDKLVHILTNDV